MKTIPKDLRARILTSKKSKPNEVEEMLDYDRSMAAALQSPFKSIKTNRSALRATVSIYRLLEAAKREVLIVTDNLGDFIPAEDDDSELGGLVWNDKDVLRILEDRLRKGVKFTVHMHSSEPDKPTKAEKLMRNYPNVYWLDKVRATSPETGLVDCVIIDGKHSRIETDVDTNKATIFINDSSVAQTQASIIGFHS